MAVADNNRRVEERQRVAGAGESTHGEGAARIVNEGEVAVVCDVVVRRDDNGGVVAKGGVTEIAVPAVDEARRCGEAVLRHLAAV